jgi:prephenate dehydrogenase
VKPPIKSISFIGLGLIGMSLLQALKQSPLAQESALLFQGYDPNLNESDRRALGELGLDSFTSDKKTLYSADLVILAAPVQVNIALLDELKLFAPPTTLVSDVSSTKSLIAKRARELELPFIGMHPMAGKEQKGYRESHKTLLRDQRVIFCDDNGLLSTEKGKFLVRLLESAGCKPLFMTADEHDQIIAKVSHLPQLLSTALMNFCGESSGSSGPGFATLTRLAGSSWEIWRDIVATNSMNIADELDHFSSELAKLSEEVRQQNLDQLASRFSAANRLSHQLNEMNRP